ncbi:MAG TPA: GGDEF domain-containing protein [Acidimicrobiia bacterium]|jgi:diguanylate cyclase (GGDEF)-like protein
MVASGADADRDFWLRHLNLGLALYAVSTAVAVTYLLLVRGPHRTALFSMGGLALACVVTVWALPRAAIAASRRRLVFFYTWTGFSILFVLTVAALDGGADSPLALILFFALAYSALAYPPVAVVVTTSCTAIGYLLLALFTAKGVGFPLLMLVVVIGVGYTAAVAAASRQRVRATLDELATHDGLTGCLTHRAFHDLLETEFARAARSDRPIAVVLVDLDHFKQINDGLGHLAGDERLRQVGAQLCAGLRVGDAAGRIGGDEFALLLPDTTLAGALALASRRLEELGETGIRATFGVAQSCVGPDPDPDACGTDPRQLLHHADRALYRAKELGRSRVEGVGCGCDDGTAAESA